MVSNKLKKSNSNICTISIKVSRYTLEDFNKCRKLLLTNESAMGRLAIQSIKQIVLGIKNACTISGKFNEKMFYEIICYPERLGYLTHIGGNTWRPLIESFNNGERDEVFKFLRKIEDEKLNSGRLKK